jgi:hypothetical protein
MSSEREPSCPHLLPECVTSIDIGIYSARYSLRFLRFFRMKGMKRLRPFTSGATRRSMHHQMLNYHLWSGICNRPYLSLDCFGVVGSYVFCDIFCPSHS